ncbi:hypothetical protein MD535_07640 [Vibrio sp. ZSDZ65]|uniref:Uncharacterized protein n=1 Tax=Vibrio qingdaonensis TaxID=2829491 RepID=A0A9X3CM26_9VIBR|nr:hypothetical protein [Vibrio qingdaonensis]MCW8345881.1 hypothetical protein [Vibrio qingdaonensis]
MSELFDVTVLNTAWTDSAGPDTDGVGSIGLFSWLSMGLFAWLRRRHAWKQA